VRVLVAMSGGVDSSSAAAVLKERGHDVIGVTMRIGFPAVDDSKKVAEALGIEHFVLDNSELFDREVVGNFVSEYSSGRTPNPCVRCNRAVKFASLVKEAERLSADLISTGHFARVSKSGGSFRLLKGADRKKDQSYMLYSLGQDVLSKCVFPNGDLTKEEVREIAKRSGLPVHAKKESQEICFIPDDDYGRFLEKARGVKAGPGPIIGPDGSVIGRHRGLIHYTVGQRKGLGISNAEPLYVTALDIERNAVIIGTREDALGTELEASGMRYVSGAAPAKKFEAGAKIRYNADEADALVEPLMGSRARVTFGTPQHAITPGQSVVLYDGEAVIGGGIIDRKLK